MRSAADAGRRAAPSFVALPLLGTLRGEQVLTGDDAHYLARVVRARAGERIAATDGEGLVGSLVVVDVRPRGAEVVVRLVGACDRVPAPAPLRLLCGAPEGERGDWLVEKLAELGVTELVPVDTARGEWSRAGARSERWDRLAIAALRQSQSAWKMRIAVAQPLAGVVAGAGEGVRWLADPEGRPVHLLEAATATPITAAVGPSSGFSPEERKLLLESGFVAAGLAVNRLRTETAAVAIAAAAACRRVRSSDGDTAPGRHP